MQPGVASVYCAVVQQTHDGSEFYIKDFPELAGTCYADARRRFNSATLCARICPVTSRLIAKRSSSKRLLEVHMIDFRDFGYLLS